MQHLVLLGDSVLDNGAYTAGGPSVIQQVSAALPAGWQTTLLAVDGSTTDDIASQLAHLPTQATHLLLSVGGNNALLRADLLETPVATSGEAFLLLREASLAFEQSYRSMLQTCLQLKLPTVVCTVYHGNFPDPTYQECVALALTAFNDVIIRTAADQCLKVIDLRAICDVPEDFANPIEPSSQGGSKVAAAIVRAVTEPTHNLRGAYVVVS